MRTFFGLITILVLSVLVASLVVALVTGNWQAAGALVLFIGIACPNFAKRARKEREKERLRQDRCASGCRCGTC